jgi:hypothetical protein
MRDSAGGRPIIGASNFALSAWTKSGESPNSPESHTESTAGYPKARMTQPTDFVARKSQPHAIFCDSSIPVAKNQGFRFMEDDCSVDTKGLQPESESQRSQIQFTSNYPGYMLTTTILQTLDKCHSNFENQRMELDQLSHERTNLVTIIRQLHACLCLSELKLSDLEQENLLLKSVRPKIVADHNLQISIPFQGHLGAKLQMLLDMEHYEPMQRVQLVLNELSNEFTVLTNDLTCTRRKLQEKESQIANLEKRVQTLITTMKSPHARPFETGPFRAFDCPSCAHFTEQLKEGLLAKSQLERLAQSVGAKSMEDLPTVISNALQQTRFEKAKLLRRHRRREIQLGREIGLLTERIKAIEAEKDELIAKLRDVTSEQSVVMGSSDAAKACMIADASRSEELRESLNTQKAENDELDRTLQQIRRQLHQVELQYEEMALNESKAKQDVLSVKAQFSEMETYYRHQIHKLEKRLKRNCRKVISPAG